MDSLERLDVFVLARDLAVRVYKITRAPPLCHHAGLANQIGRAATSVPANLAEAYGLGTTRQLIRGLRISYGSCLELRTHLWIAARADALPSSPATSRIVADLDRVIRMLVGLLKHYGARVAV